MRSVDVCPFCGEAHREVLSEFDGRDIYLDLIDAQLNQQLRAWYKYQSCDFIYRSPVITEAEAEVLYAKYRSYEFRGERPDAYFDRITAIPDAESDVYAKTRFLVQNIHEEVKSILDVGCGGGIFLHWLARGFPNAYLCGLEPNEEFAEMVERKLGIEVICEYYSKEAVKRDFDLTVSADVVEHIHDIDVFWKGAGDNISAGGYLYVDVPSPANFANLPAEHDVFMSPHLYFFGESHIDRMAGKYGFERVALKSVEQRGVTKDWYLYRKVS